MSEKSITPTFKDYLNNTAPKWCPGCGDFVALRSLAEVFAASGRPPHEFLVVSGIGCSGRMPYYLSTYGLHSLHGRAPTVAIGAKMTRPELSVWVITGDGDALSIGANHFIHCIRRNPDINILILNNQVYGLTKGQASPTTPTGHATVSTPFGSLAQPTNAMALAIASGATFAARTSVFDKDHMNDILLKAMQHRGTSVVEILVNCVIFEKDAYADLQTREDRAKHTIYLEPGKPLEWGTQDQFHRLDWHGQEWSTHSATTIPTLVHKPNLADLGYSLSLASLTPPDYPRILGILRQVEREVYEESDLKIRTRHPEAKDFHSVVDGGQSWDIDPNEKI